ncbi:MAG: hypothetical protein H6983_08865 [Ectothiorhodospiraceae bacterium]|nr:hypothetical protein [Planctomycetota bacterium]MCP5152413.1 hypothetical protein [Chromatiales bacterium]MCP5154261.1 hypothetical protein [Ectothiorhodospiraceae bacterium]
MRERLREHLAAQSAGWHHAGLIDADLAATLGRRYDRQGRFLSVMLRWLGAFAAFWLVLSVLSFVGAMSESLAVGAVLLGMVSVGIGVLGVRLATEAAARFPLSGSILVTVALAGCFGTLLLLAMATGAEPDEDLVPPLLLASAAAAIGVAYRYHMRWPLLLGLLMAFHGLGAWHAYGGGGGYFADVQEPRVMAPIALAVAVLGLWHERREDGGPLVRLVGFGHLYLILGLVYFNVSLWFLTLPRGELGWVVAFSAAAVAQIVAGARLQDGRITGFGVVFLAIDLYTRFHERFWDRLSLATVLIVCGLAAMGIGYLIERLRATGTEGETS